MSGTTRGVVAAVVAVMAVVAGVSALTGPDGAARPAVSGTLPAAPEGTRWVGAEGVVVAVPEWWTTGETQCGAPVEDTVYFDAAAVHDCADPADPATVRQVSALAVLDATCCYGEWKARTMVPVPGSPAVEQAACDRWFEGVCRRLFMLPGTDVVLAVTIADEGDGRYEAIRDSARVLPPGTTTVPLRVGSGFTPGHGLEPSLVDDTVRAIERAGLSVEVDEVGPEGGRDLGLRDDLPRGSLLGVAPAPGSVVEEGATVTLTVVR